MKFNHAIHAGLNLHAWLSAASYHLGTTLKRNNIENSKQTFPEKELRGLICCRKICVPILRIYNSLTDT